jgi:hypothetical protein
MQLIHQLINRLTIITTFFALLTLAGCGGGGDSTAARVAPTTPIALTSVDGEWISNCQGTTEATILLNSNGTGRISVRDYIDGSNCTELISYLEDAEYTYTLGSAVPLDGTIAGITSATKINFTFTSGATGNLYNIISINDNNKMYIGDASIIEELRPTDLIGYLVYKKRYLVGDTGPAGGVVFHTTNRGIDGLEASKEDLKSGEEISVPWGCKGTDIVGASGRSVGTGAQNTAAIISGCKGTTAASVAVSMGPGWFLPSFDEFTLIAEQSRSGLSGLQNFGVVYYWSSSQWDLNTAYCNSAYLNEYPECTPIQEYHKDSMNGVRAIRAF